MIGAEPKGMPAHGSRWQYRGAWFGIVDVETVRGKVRCSPEGHTGTPYDWPPEAFLRAFTLAPKP